MMRVATVITHSGVDKGLDYLVSPDLVARVGIGERVVVPLRGGTVGGVVVALRDCEDAGRSLKAIERVADGAAGIPDGLLRLAKWMGGYYMAGLDSAIRSILPAPVRGTRGGFKTRRTVGLATDRAESGAGGSNLKDAGSVTAKQHRVLSYLEQRGESVLEELLGELGLGEAVVKRLVEKGLLRMGSEVVGRRPNPGEQVLRTLPLKLTDEQAGALSAIIAVMEQKAAGDVTAPGAVLLHGVTGSGKTEVYLQAIAHSLERGRGAVVLVPEISLTPQTVETFVSRFGARVAVMHSRLSDGERHDEWHRVLAGKADIVVGARSSVFAPVHPLGLIVVDEEHEPSYKQEEAPRYHARDVAVMRGVMEGCAVVLGSATPSIESFRNVSAGKYRLTTLSRRVDNRTMPVLRIVDMRMEGRGEGRGGGKLLSPTLLEALRGRLERGEQSMLFLNRRGYSTSLVCPKCGHVATCSECSVSYTYHKTDERLRCHICGGNKGVPACCPECRDPAFRYAGVGTQKIESVVRACLPGARVERMDADTTARRGSHERVLGAFRSGRTDILIGTQMIAKGLHFPNVTLVGVVNADLSLHMPDFRASERTFQLLVQVAGRAGRGDVKGEVIVQTFTPFHEAIQAVRRLDYAGFVEQELEWRKQLNYPPFSHLICVTLRGKNEEEVSFCSAALAKRLGTALSGKAAVSEATPAPLAKAKGSFRYQIIVRAQAVRTVGTVLAGVVREMHLPTRVSVSVDVDAQHLT